ncbi:U3 small nucleolar RNA-associated protein 6 homolog [Octopus bimaculoides]|uniref:U3 small nucleolar RNA-associated protein 6 homolog n=1 Tax=Octopus bimaculoides TaxID=37653 RepID=A0A0L8HRM0_OCTBM|nr:U3 small nucleolar RNA-associated protein 6 homolog [Octopus bimaculoides]|eukprot:XP_014770431.1 PREDICTED: U3 small nucleolar RNA-associated protein 6 homolog [Octopus bimaculoides]
MAEFVQQKIEEMIPEMEEMVRTKLFTNDETGRILRRRRAFEYKLKKMKKSLPDFIAYIQYEQNVLSLIRIRRRQLRCKSKICEIDVAIIQRIHRLFRQATKYFPNDLPLWLSHIEFAKKRNQKSTVNRIFSKMLRMHNQNASLWILAAKHHFESGETPLARKFFHQGLRFNNTSQLLWLEYYRLELLCCDKARKRLEILEVTSEETPHSKQSTINGQIAFVVFKEAHEAIAGDVSFLLKFLPICRLFDFTEHHEEEIFTLLLNQYKENELVWDALARRKFYYAAKDYNKSLIPLKIYQDCFHSYEKSLEVKSTPSMLNMYLEFMFEQLQENNMKITNYLKEHILTVFETYSQKQLLSADNFLKWLQFQSDVGSVSKALKVAEFAVQKFPKDLRIWHGFLDLQILNDIDFGTVYASFGKALDNLISQNTWPLWESLLNFAKKCKSSEIELIFKQGRSQPNIDLVGKINTHYLKWIYNTSGILKARSEYKELSKQKPVSLDFYKEFIVLEKSQKNPNIDSLRIVYEDAVQEYGKDIPDFWLQYINLESTHPKGKVEKLSSIHFRAIKVLQAEKLEEFNLKYILIKTGQLKN